MQILPGFFLHFSSNSAHLSHIHRLFYHFSSIFAHLSAKSTSLLVHIGHFGPTTNKNLFSEFLGVIVILQAIIFVTTMFISML